MSTSKGCPAIGTAGSVLGVEKNAEAEDVNKSKSKGMSLQKFMAVPKGGGAILGQSVR